ncbi:type IV secretory system conjugative DNA transfer family protein [Maricaulis virginensis]|uniref:Conjugal transfer protein TraG n=1 Tax=Maricaulis virginensis TaxID=144022 RepID=A0A9W6IJ98_9PROT|nr:type IV secretory system conjugative DNA transfer family protein [Maricaulis virginensis]GLK50509.1 conjugal transfer protein TraG [Maricaulis virginensis]
MTTRANSGSSAPSGLITKIVISAAFAWGYTQSDHLFNTQYFWVPTFALILALGAPIALARVILSFAIRKTRVAIADTPSTRHGSARWASLADFAWLRKRRNGPFWGALEGKPLFLEYEANALTVAPAGAGKTISVVVPQLLSIKGAMVVSDLKCELAPMTKRARERMGQPVYCLNPSGTNVDVLGEPDAYNPLCILHDDWMHSPADMVADAMGMAHQLHPEPATKTDNSFFREGSRNLITFAMLWEVIDKGEAATLPGGLRLLRDPDRLREALYAASVSDLLSGELTDRANDFLEKLNNGDTRQIESFREGAVQSLAIFSASGRIADSVSRCTFRFRDLKTKPATVFIIGDATRSKVYEPWVGLVAWCAMLEIKRCRTQKNPATFLLDEASNFRVDGLPQSMMEARGFGMRFHVIIQELEDFKRVYGREALEILLSQTEIQQFFASRSPGTLEMLSRRLGNATVKTDNYALDGHWPRRSMGETGRPLLLADEIRQLRDCLLFAHGKAPALVGKVGYHECSPWNRRGYVGINPLHGKRLKGRTRLRL